MKRVFANMGWLLGGRGFNAVLSLVYLALATRTLGLDGFGAFWVTAMAFAASVLMFAVGGIVAMTAQRAGRRWGRGVGGCRRRLQGGGRRHGAGWAWRVVAPWRSAAHKAAARAAITPSIATDCRAARPSRALRHVSSRRVSRRSWVPATTGSSAAGQRPTASRRTSTSTSRRPTTPDPRARKMR